MKAGSAYAYPQLMGLLLGPLLFGLTLALYRPPGLEPAALAVLATTLWVATWWISEAAPIEVTALLPAILFPLTGALTAKEATQAYGHPLVFLFLGGFMIALAIERWNLHRRIALSIIARVGTNGPRLVLGFMLATAFLSMWISNTATALMMMPIGLAIVRQLTGTEADSPAPATPFAKALMLGIAYSASIGGMSTLIGTPPNLVFAAVVRDMFEVEVSFARWFFFAFPFATGLLLLCWWYLTKVAFRLQVRATEAGQAEVLAQLRQLGPLRPAEILVLLVFVLTALAWISRSFLLARWIPLLDDTLIALCGAFVLFLLPVPGEPGQRLMDWRATQRLPWGILLLFGGGMSLAVGFAQSGLATWIGQQMNLLEGISLLLVLVIITAAVNFLTEITSNLATASMIMPILAALALAMGVHPYGLMVPAILAASCAFMLPVATPPNAVVFGSEVIAMRDMVKAGFWMNVLSIILISLYVLTMLPLVWGLALDTLPPAFRP